MDSLRLFLTTHGFGAGSLVVGLVAAGLSLLRWQRSRTWSWPTMVVAGFLCLVGLGGLGVPVAASWGWPDVSYWSIWAMSACLAILFAKLVFVILTGQWHAPTAWVLAGLSVVFLGASFGQTATLAIVELSDVAMRLEVVQPWWLLLFGLVPVLYWQGRRSLAGLGPVRRWLAFGLRAALVVLLTLALAELRLRHANESITVLFLVDRSLSIPEEFDVGPRDSATKARIDRRWERIKKFVNDSVELYKKQPGRQRDKAGLVVFGRRPRLELPPSEAPRFNFQEVASVVDTNYTDIGAAIKLALASFPEGSAKRIVLLSDGNENLGNAEEQARIARQNGVQIDVVPLASGQRNESEVLVQSIEAPSRTEQGARVPIRILLRSFNPRPVVGKLTLRRLEVRDDGKGQNEEIVKPTPQIVMVRQGLNSFKIEEDRLEKKSYTYEATFEPEGVLGDENDKQLEVLVGDRVQNNRVTTHVVALGQRRILFVEGKSGEHEYLVAQLANIGEQKKFKVHALSAEMLPQDKDKLGVFLSNYDCVVLANVSADLLNEEQQEMIRSNTHDQGCGLVMIGGPDSYGAGGWQGTAVEKALPVDCDIKSLKVMGKGGLVLIMHACEMANGNFWEKKIAKLALDKLSQNDEFGVMPGDNNIGGTWCIKLQQIGENRDKMKRRIDKMQPFDFPEFDTSLNAAHKALVEKGRDIATKKIIIISDGDPQQTQAGLLQRIRADGIRVSTIGVGTHGAPMDAALQKIATATGGKYYNVKSANALPSVYIKETRLISQSFVHEKTFQPSFNKVVGGPTDGLPAKLPQLHGFVRTTPKVSQLVEKPILGPSMEDLEFPVLAYWTYGLGRSVAFTSDARSEPPERAFWDKDWASSEMYLKFWEQILDYSVRSVETGRLTMTTEYRDGKIKVTVNARDHANRPITDLNLEGGITLPGVKADAKKQPIRFEQKNSGVYEATVRADEAGSYFINAQAKRKVKDDKGVERVETDSVRAGVTIPYSPEFTDLETNTALLERIRSATGGQTYADDDAELKAAARDGEVFRRSDLPRSRSLQPIWFWLLLACGFLMFFDVAVRRIAVDPSEAWVAGQRAWERLRGRTVAATATPQFFDRLKTRKAQVSEEIAKAKASQRFEASDEPAKPAPAGADEMSKGPTQPLGRPPAAPSLSNQPKPEGEPTDYASRLMRAKKRARQDKDKDKES